VRSSLKPVRHGPKDIAHDKWAGRVTAYTSEVNDDDFVQARDLWHLLGNEDGQQEFLITNVTNHLKKAIPKVRSETIGESLAVVNPSDTC
jgi:catalase